MRGPACGGWSGCAAVVPGDSLAGEVVVGGLLNFLNIYNILITGRVLLSWVPQVRECPALMSKPTSLVLFFFKRPPLNCLLLLPALPINLLASNILCRYTQQKPLGKAAAEELTNHLGAGRYGC